MRLWCRRFGQAFAKRLRHSQGQLGDTWRVDEMFVTINGERHYTMGMWCKSETEDE